MNNKEKIKTIHVIISVMFILMMISGCEGHKNLETSGITGSPFNTYLDIPGITEEEIAAIKALRNQVDEFIYGMTLSAESFINEYGELSGFSVLLCDLLTELFDIPFRLELYDWDELWADFEAGKVSFTRERKPVDLSFQYFSIDGAIASRPYTYFRIPDSQPLSVIAQDRPLHLAFFDGTTALQVVAENGQIGVDLVRQRIEKNEKQFDLIFMDMHMPVMDGLEATEKILKFNVNIPIVALTANIMSGDREIYRTSGMVDYVGKPFTSQELWRCLMRFFTPINWKTENKAEWTKKENELRQMLINNFILNNRDNYTKIKDAIDTGDLTSAHRLAHTLKTNAAQLEKTLLQQAA